MLSKNVDKQSFPSTTNRMNHSTSFHPAVAQQLMCQRTSSTITYITNVKKELKAPRGKNMLR